MNTSSLPHNKFLTCYHSYPTTWFIIPQKFHKVPAYLSLCIHIQIIIRQIYSPSSHHKNHPNNHIISSINKDHKSAHGFIHISHSLIFQHTCFIPPFGFSMAYSYFYSQLLLQGLIPLLQTPKN